MVEKKPILDCRAVDDPVSVSVYRLQTLNLWIFGSSWWNREFNRGEGEGGKGKGREEGKSRD